VQCEEIASGIIVTTAKKKKGLVEKILIIVSIPKNSPNSDLRLKNQSHTSLATYLTLVYQWTNNNYCSKCDDNNINYIDN
jgi:hypothetical protein